MRRGAAAVLFAAVLLTQPGEAHKGITSKFTYHVEVYPIFLNRCGRCHVDGGVGPMSLLKYEDAFPWAESLRSELLGVSDNLPRLAPRPEHALTDLEIAADAAIERLKREGPTAKEVPAGPEAGDFVKAAHRQISARELDIILDWATGGTPEGNTANAATPVAWRNDWTHGTPDLSVAMARPFDMPADTLESTREFVLPMPIALPRAAARFDLLPGNPSIVRSATVSIRSKDGQIRALGTWFPRQTPVPLALKPVVRLEPGAEVIARIHYKKTWKSEGQPMSDRSTIGFYFPD